MNEFLIIFSSVVLCLVVGARATNKQRKLKQREQQKRKLREQYGRDWEHDPTPLTFSLDPEIEAFTREPLPAGQQFAITITGTYTCAGHGFLSGSWAYAADACYSALDGNFTKRYHQLFFDSRHAPSPFAADRAVHRYTFAYTGTGGRLSILLNLPDKDSFARKLLTIEVRPLSPAEQTVADEKELKEKMMQEMAEHHVQAEREAERAAREEEEYQAKEEKRGREEAKRRAEIEERERTLREQAARQAAAVLARQEAAEEAKREEQVRAQRERLRAEQERQKSKREAEEKQHARVRELTLRYEALPHYENNEWLKRRAEKYNQTILRDRDRIIKENAQFHQDHSFMTYLKQQASHTYQRATWEIRLLAIAEQVDTEETSPPPPRKKHTAEEIRQRIVRRIQVQTQDQIAVTKAKALAIQEARKELDECDLDPDERQQLEAELIEEILKEEVSRAPTTTETL